MAVPDPSRYRSGDEDSARWDAVGLRSGDVVISTRSKSGTTWMQMICALLIHGGARLPEPLGVLSPWVDHLVEPLDALVARLDSQPWRRVLKTHTPLDGIPLDPRVTYVVVARHPLDAAVSLYHQGANIDRERVAELARAAGADVPDAAQATQAPQATQRRERPPLRTWLADWIEDDPDPRAALDSLPGFCLHLRDAWARRTAPNVLLVHYDDLQADLDAAMRTVARRLAIDVDRQRWPQLVAAASFDGMRARAAELAPAAGGVLRDPSAFFRRGRSGAAAEVLDAAATGRYRGRVAGLLPDDLDSWLHRA